VNYQPRYPFAPRNAPVPISVPGRFGPLNRYKPIFKPKSTVDDQGRPDFGTRPWRSSSQPPIGQCASLPVRGANTTSKTPFARTGRGRGEMAHRRHAQKPQRLHWWVRVSSGAVVEFDDLDLAPTKRTELIGRLRLAAELVMTQDQEPVATLGALTHARPALRRNRNAPTCGHRTPDKPRPIVYRQGSHRELLAASRDRARINRNDGLLEGRLLGEHPDGGAGEARRPARPAGDPRVD
jgi:hypothetical protein